jgi:hypothetical protein
MNKSLRLFLPMAAMLCFCFLIGGAWAQSPRTDFRQAANKDTTLGVAHWINSILQQNNSKYFEGMSSLQRLIFKSIPATSGNAHTLTLSHQSIKDGTGGAHAYDFLTSWDQAVAAAEAIAPGQGLLVDTNECGPEPSSDPQGYLTTCATLHLGGFTATPSVPDTMGDPTLGGNVDTRIANYEIKFGNRTIKIYSNAAITASSLVFNGYSGTDQDANYTLTWTSSSPDIVIEFAGHLAVGVDPLNAAIGYGPGLGASSVSGGPYHISLDRLDGGSLGNQDNQIKGADILIPCPTCNVSGPSACLSGFDERHSVTFTGICTNQEITWSISGRYQDLLVPVTVIAGRRNAPTR